MFYRCFITKQNLDSTFRTKPSFYINFRVHVPWNTRALYVEQSVTHITSHTTLLRLVPQAGQTISLVALRAGDKELSSTLSSCSGDILVPTFVPRP